MSSYAKANLIGNLGRDPEIRYTNAGTMNVSFSIAVSTKFGQKENTTWFRCTAWGKLAEFLDRAFQEGNLAKGKQVFVSGRIEQTEYTTNDGAKRTSLDVNADDVILLSPRVNAPVAEDVKDLPF